MSKEQTNELVERVFRIIMKIDKLAQQVDMAFELEYINNIERKYIELLGGGGGNNEK